MGHRLNRFAGAGIIVMSMILVMHAEMRTWTSTTGQTVEGEYVSVTFDQVNIKNPQGGMVKLPMESLSKEDRSFVELANPPDLKVDILESQRQRQIDGRTWTSNTGWTGLGTPVYVMKARFGARITQTSRTAYGHALEVEIFVLTKQLYDPDKYHLISRSRSAPFILTDSNQYRYEYAGGKEQEIIYYTHASAPRGEKPAEHLILVWDERGELIAYNSTKKWLYHNLDKLMALPVGAWIDDTCARVYPTSPEPWYGD